MISCGKDPILYQKLYMWQVMFPFFNMSPDANSKTHTQQNFMKNYGMIINCGYGIKYPRGIWGF